MRRKWIADQQTLRLKAKLTNGRGVERTKKLFNVEALTSSQELIVDRPRCVDILASFYSKKWGGNKPDIRVRFLERMVCHERREIDLSVQDLAASFKLLKRKCILDAHGVSPRALELLFIANLKSWCLSFALLCLHHRVWLLCHVEVSPWATNHPGLLWTKCG